MTEQIRPEVLISRLTADNETWRVEAETRLVALGQAAVVPLIGATQNAHPSVRMHAVHALGQIKDRRAIPAVIGALADAENNGAVAIAAEKALVNWGEEVKPPLIEAASGGADHVRPRVLRALGRIGGEDLRPHLEPLLRDRLSTVRTQAAAALAAALAERSVEVIAPLLRDPDKWVRYGVAEALVRCGSVRGASVLQEAKEDAEEQGVYLRYWAEELLDEIDELNRTGRAIP
jgi:HEAT repeat protein